jgi:hypothetical protein
VAAVLLALDKLGLTQELKPKIKWVRRAASCRTAVAKGEYELAFGPYLSDMRNPGLDVVGALPPEASTGRHHGVPVDQREGSKAARALLDTSSHRRLRLCTRSAKIFPVR